MQTLHWEKKSAGRWALKTADGQLWAEVTPYRAEHACKNQFKATVLNGDYGTFHFAGKDTGTRYWTTGIGVGAAKRNIVAWLERNHCATENFEIAS